MKKFKFKLDTIKVIRQMIIKDDFFISVDLSKAYYHLPVNKEHQQYLGFSINGKYYRMLALPMGGQYSPYAFQLLAKQVILYIRRTLRVPRSSVYLDDGIFIITKYQRALKLSKEIKQLYINLGFLLNEPKSMFEPAQICLHLGFLLDSVNMTVTASKKQQQKIKDAVGQLLQCYRSGLMLDISLRDLAKLPGRIISQMPAVGPIAKIFSKELLHLIDDTIKHHGLLSADKQAWEIRVQQLPLAVVNELEFWEQYSFPSVPLQPIRGIITMVTDASDTRVGAFLLLPGLQYEFSEPLPKALIGTDSTIREMYGVRRVLQHWLQFIIGTSLLIKTDSQAASFVLGGRFFTSGGSNKRHLNSEAKKIFLLLLNHSIKPVVEWHRRNTPLAQRADDLSKIFMKYEYGVSTKIFNRINKWYMTLTGHPLACDVFASYERHHLDHFMTRYECKGSMGNALVSPWPNHFYCHPPLRLIPEALRLAVVKQKAGIFIIPNYKSEWWFGGCINQAKDKLRLGSMIDVLENHNLPQLETTTMLALYIHSG